VARVDPRIVRWAAPAVVVATTLAAFIPVLSNGFIDWDDQTNFVANLAYQGLGRSQLAWMATAFHLGVYQPLAWLVAAVEVAIGGVTPLAFHVGSWLLHAATAGLVYAIAVYLLTPLSPSLNRVRVCAAAAALAWAVHPLRVEAVAWASAQGYPLAGLLFAGSVAAYLRFHTADPGTGRASDRRWYAASVVLALAAYLAKPIAVTLPAILLLLDWYPLRRLARRDGATHHPASVWVEKLPHAIPAVLVAAAAPLARARIDTGAHEAYDALDRAVQAAYGIVFYALKTVAPFGLSVFYPRPSEIDPFDARFLVSAVVVVGLAVGLWVMRHRRPALAAGALAYVILLSPVLGLIRQGDQLAADRYAYFAGIPLAIGMGAAALAVWGRLGSRRRVIKAGVAGIVVVGLVLFTLTWRQTEAWRDPGTLWEHAVRVDPGSFQAHTNLGLYHLNRKDYDTALREFDDVLRLNPASAKALFNRGLTLARQGRPNDAIESYQRGLVLRPNDPTALAHAGELLAGKGRYPEAESSYRRAVALAPHPDLFNSLGIALAEQGRLDDAIGAFREALARDPRHEDARANLETALKERSR
jgi:tetratricopeptide (TPR) repeat protein